MVCLVLVVFQQPPHVHPGSVSSRIEKNDVRLYFKDDTQESQPVLCQAYNSLQERFCIQEKTEPPQVERLCRKDKVREKVYLLGCGVNRR